MIEETATPTQEMTEEAPITPEAVAGNIPAQPSVPDSSIVADRFNRSIPQKVDPQVVEFQKLTSEIAELRKLRGDVPEAPKPSPKPAERDEAIVSLKEELAALREEQQGWRTQLEEERRRAEYNSAQEQVSAWVSSNDFPLINAIGAQRIVWQRMWNSRMPDGQMMSEGRAARETEAELRATVEQLAPKLGFMKSDEQHASEDAVPINQAMNIREPLNRDTMSKEERLEYLIRQAQGQR